MPSVQCPYCKEHFNTQRALNHHIPGKASCLQAQEKAVAAIRQRALEMMDNALDVEIPGDDGSDDEMHGQDEPQRVDSGDENLLEGEDFMDVFVDAPAPELNRGQSAPPRATVEDYEDSDEEQEEVDFVEVETFYEKRNAGKSFGVAPTKFEQWKQQLEKAMKDETKATKAPFSLSLHEDNWGLANWLMTSGLSGKACNKFFNLPQVMHLLLIYNETHLRRLE